MSVRQRMRVLILRRAADDGARLQQLFDRLDADAGLSIVESSADILPPADHDPRFEFVILSPAYAEERSLAAVARAFPGSRVMAIIERADGWSLLGRDGLADGGRTFPAMESLAGAIRQVLRAHGSGNTRREAIERRTRQLAHLGRYDPLTGLYEVGYLDVLFGDQRTIIDRRGCVTAYVVNLDGFSRVNQTHGYVCGDRLLRTVAECVAAFAGSQGVACRLASDEFLAIVTMHDNVAAILGGQRLCRQIRRLRVRSGAGEVGATVSVGMSEVADGNLSPDDIDRARAASSTAKYLGGDRACGWEWASFLQSARPDLRDRALSDEIRLDRLLARMRATMSVTHWTHVVTHGQEVARLSARLADALDLDPAERENLRIAGLYHDLGKLVVPETILAKPTWLSAAERLLLAQHADDGAVMARSMGLSDRICELISVHHDHFASASGFGVHATEEAQLSARIIAVADALSSMVSFNVYSPRRSYSAAVRELQRQSGRQFAPQVVSAVPAAVLAEAPWANQVAAPALS